MPANQKHPVITTLEEYETLPDDIRAEIIDGDIYYDPQRKSVTVNYFEGNLINVPYTFDSIIKVNIYEDLYINFSDISRLLNI